MFTGMSGLELISIVLMGMTLILILANLIANKKFSWINLFLFLIIFGVYVLKYFSKTNFDKVFGKIGYIELYMQMTSGAIFLITLLLFIIATDNMRKNKALLKEVVVLSHNVLGVTNRKNKILAYDQKIKSLLNKEYDGDVFIQGSKINQITKKDLFKFKDDFISVKIVKNDTIVDEIKISKQEVRPKKKLLGYAFMDISSKKFAIDAVNFKNDILVYMDLLNQPIAYFDEPTLSYVCSTSLIKLLDLKEKTVKLSDFKNLILKEDLSVYETKLNKSVHPGTYSYRLNTSKGPVWFEESTVNINNKEYTLIKMTEYNNISGIKYGTHRDFVHLISNKKDLNYGILMINFIGIEKYLVDKPHEFIDALINNFFVKVNEGFLRGQFLVYKIGTFEFAMVVEDTVNVDILVREFGKNISPLLTQTINVNDVQYELNTEIGIVYGSDFEEADPKDIIKASFDIIAEVSNPTFKERFSIYQPVKRTEFSLMELGIDIDEDLSKYE